MGDCREDTKGDKDRTGRITPCRCLSILSKTTSPPASAAKYTYCPRHFLSSVLVIVHVRNSAYCTHIAWGRDTKRSLPRNISRDCYKSVISGWRGCAESLTPLPSSWRASGKRPCRTRKLQYGARTNWVLPNLVAAAVAIFIVRVIVSTIPVVRGSTSSAREAAQTRPKRGDLPTFMPPEGVQVWQI